MTDYGVLANLLVIFTVSIAVVFVFHQFRLPSIAGFLVAGALIGPHGLNLISDIGAVQVLAEIGVVLLLFTIGIEFSLVQMASLRRLMFLAAPIQVGGVLLIAWLGAMLAGLSWQQGLFWGFLFSLSSTAIVLKTLAERGDSDSIHGRATIGILVFQDLAVVPMMLLTPILASQSDGGGSAILLTLGKSILVVVLVIAAAWYLVPKLLEHIVRSRSRELFLLTIIVLCLGIAWLTSLGGLSLALGAFIAGLVISESEYSHQAMAEVLPFRDSFNSLFFVSIGILLDWRVLLRHPLPVAGLLVTILLVKFVAGGGAVLLAKIPPRSAIMVGIALAQVGEFSFLLAQQGQENGLLRGDPYQVFLAVSVLSMIVTPFLMQWSPHLARRAEAWQRLRHWLPHPYHRPRPADRGEADSDEGPRHYCRVWVEREESRPRPRRHGDPLPCLGSRWRYRQPRSETRGARLLRRCHESECVAAHEDRGREGARGRHLGSVYHPADRAGRQGTQPERACRRADPLSARIGGAAPTRRG